MARVVDVREKFLELQFVQVLKEPSMVVLVMLDYVSVSVLACCWCGHKGKCECVVSLLVSVVSGFTQVWFALHSHVSYVPNKKKKKSG